MVDIKEEIAYKILQKYSNMPVDLEKRMDETLTLLNTRYNFSTIDLLLIRTMCKAIYVNGLQNGVNSVGDSLEEFKKIKKN